MKVLVVEDSSVIRRLLIEILRSRGHEVTECEDGESALARYAEAPYPLVLLDWQLPGMDGIELCRRIRALPGGDRTLIIMVTARDQPEALRSALASGVDDYVPKPIEASSFDIRLTVAEKQVANLLERKKAESELSRAMAEIARRRDDLASILDRLQLGTAMIDPGGRITFLSRAAEDLLGRPAAVAIGCRWDEILPLAPADRDALRRMADSPPRERSRVAAPVDSPAGGRRWTEIEVHDDPRDAQGKILVLYDVSEVHTLRRLLDEKAQFHDLIGRSAAMVQVCELIRQVATVDATVLVEGETGTGKDLVARAIHAESRRRDRPFIAVNCAALADSLLASQLFGHRRGAFTGAMEDHAGLFEAADGGTLFLDEIGDVSPNVQVSLLRVLQEKEVMRLGETRARTVDVRVIAATHHDLARDVERGTFRSDLFYRIRIARIHLAPLRERREDIPALVSAFLAQSRAASGKSLEGVSDEALAQLVAYAWPGNVRELRSALEFAVIRCTGPVLRVADLPPEIVAADGGRPEVARLAPDSDRERILQALASARGNRSVAARLLGISRATFYRRLVELGIAAKGA